MVNRVKARLRRRNDRYTIYDLELTDFMLSVTYLNPRKSTVGHKHTYEEGYYIAEGFGKMELGEEIRLVIAGDFIAIPPNVFHRVLNESSMALVFICAFGRNN